MFSSCKNVVSISNVAPWSQRIRFSSATSSRLPILRQLLAKNKDIRPLRFMETHNGLTGLIVEKARATKVSGEVVEFDGFWSSSLTASTAKGKPDIEVVDTRERLDLVRETLAVTTKPLIYDADTGGLPEVFRYTVRALEDLGVSAAIIEDKSGLKQNSLFGTDRKQVLEDIPSFCAKIIAGQESKRHEDFMIVARLEALIAGHGEQEALTRAAAYVEAGVDAIMIHSKEKDPTEVLSFLRKFRANICGTTPIVAVPTTYNSLYEDELGKAGANIIIHANHMLRAAYPAMVHTAQMVLEHGRSKEADSDLMGVKEILTMIDETPGQVIKVPSIVNKD